MNDGGAGASPVPERSEQGFDFSCEPDKNPGDERQPPEQPWKSGPIEPALSLSKGPR
jgi:hypothetical protein